MRALQVMTAALCPLLITAQTISIIHYNPFAGNERAAGAVYVPGDGYYWVGRTDAYGSQDILVIKYDLQGNLVWSYAYDFGNDERAHGVAPVTGGGILIAGEIRGWIRDGLAIRIDPQGNPVFVRQLQGFRALFTDVIEHSNGSFYFVGKEQIGGFGGSDEVVLVRLSSAGNVINYVYYDDGGTNNDEFAYALRELPNGDIVIVGETDAGGSWNWLVIRVDPQTLNVIASVYIDFPSNGNNDEAALDVTGDNAGNIYVAGEYTDFNGTTFPALVKLNGNLTSVLARMYLSVPGGGYMNGIHYEAALGQLHWSGVNSYFGDRDLMVGATDVNLTTVKIVNLGRGTSNETDAELYFEPATRLFVVSGITDYNNVNDDPFFVAFKDSPQVLRCGVRPLNISGQTMNTSITSYNLTAQNGPSGFASPSPTIYNGTGTNGCYCPITAAFTSTADPYACTGESISFTYMGDTLGMLSYQWSFGLGANPATSNVQNPSGIVYTSSGSKVVTLTVRDGSCSATVSEGITVHLTPTVAFAVSDTQPCETEPVQFTNLGSTGSGWSYQWSFGVDANPTTSNAENPGGVYWTSPGQKVVVFTISSPYCSASDTLHISVQDKPVAQFSAPVRVCQGDTATFRFHGEAQANATYVWTIPAGVPSTVTNDTIAQSVFGPTGWQTVQLVVTNPNGCADTVSGQVLVDSTPVVQFSSSAPVCAGEAVQFTNSGTSGSAWAFHWDFGPGATPRTSTQEHPGGIVYDSGGAKLVTLEVRNVYTGCSAVDTGTILIWALPPADAGPPDTTICFGTSVQLGTPGLPGLTYMWTPAENLDDPTSAMPIASPDASITVYHLVVTDANGCQNRDSITVIMLDPIEVEAGPDVEICYGDTVQLSATFNERYAYVWTPAYWISDVSVPDPYVWPDSTIIYQVTVIDTSQYACGSASDEIQVIVHPLPNIRIVPKVDTIARGESVQLVASGGVQYEWFPEYGLDHSGVYNPIASPETTTVYVVRVVDVYGCVNWDTAIVYVREPEVWIPSAFSPNGDGLNDDIGVEGYGFVRYDFRVFDRYGGLVFYSQDPGIRWDGRHIGTGEPCPEGAYIYRFEGELSNGKRVEMQGIINLIR